MVLSLLHSPTPLPPPPPPSPCTFCCTYACSQLIQPLRMQLGSQPWTTQMLRDTTTALFFSVSTEQQTSSSMCTHLSLCVDTVRVDVDARLCTHMHVCVQYVHVCVQCNPSSWSGLDLIARHQCSHRVMRPQMTVPTL